MACPLTTNKKSDYFSNLFYVKTFLTVLVLTLLIFPLSSKASENTGNDSLFTVNQLHEDLDLVWDVLDKAHAGTFRYTPKEEMQKLYEDIRSNMKEPMNDKEFLLKVAPLIDRIKCGHTRIALSRESNNEINNAPVSIPFGLEIIEGKTYLVRNYSELEKIDLGGEVISINGRPIDTIITDMLPLITSDAGILTWKYHYLKTLNNFSRFFAILYGESNKFSIIYKSPSANKEITLDVKGINREIMMSIAAERYPELFADQPPISSTYINGIPVLVINTFEEPSYEEAGIVFQEYIADYFKTLREKNEKNLIIDVRDNDGGEGELGRVLATYLFDKPFYYYESLQFKKKSYGFWEHTNATQQNWDEIAGIGVENSNGWYDYTEDPGLGLQQNNDMYFKGNAYILINGKSFSTTGEFASVVHYNKRAKFIGSEECGAGYYGNTSGFLPVLNLPNTKLRMSLPLIKYTVAVDDYPKNHGLIPDYNITPSIKDIIEGNDPEMDFLIKLITE